ncbi:hypothetical protein A0256_15120 [Mucilaginibacter sp. PAMC 26640]|nr:hypothetical protein A0256_15120 [Mucilaginibacter sp. PAMC 26640]
MKKHYRHQNDCLNCSTILEGKFCHKCGQENLEMKESFWHMLNHAVSDYFHFDDQFFHTLKPLFANPGKLTVEYLAGHRAQYLHPVKMYIFISLIFFVLFFHGNDRNVVQIKDSKESGAMAIDTIQHNLGKDIDNDKSLTAAQKKSVKEKLNRFLPGVALDTSLAKDTTKKLSKPAIAEQERNENGIFNFIEDDKSIRNYGDYLAKQKTLPAHQRDGFITRYIEKKSFDWENQGKNAREVFAEAFKHNVPKMMFLLLPLFAFILSVAFYKNRKFYVEHVIYAIHLHCFLFLFLAASILLKMLIPPGMKAIADIIDFIVTLAIVYYIYRSLKVVYKRSRWRTISKMMGVSAMYFLVFGVCFILIAAVTAITTV